MVEGGREAGGAQAAGGEAGGGFAVAARGVSVGRGIAREGFFAGGGAGKAELQQRVERGRGRIVVGGCGGNVGFGDGGLVDEVQSPEQFLDAPVGAFAFDEVGEIGEGDGNFAGVGKTAPEFAGVQEPAREGGVE